MPYTPMQLAEVFLKTGELDDALEALQQQLQDHPEDDDARRMRIQILLRQRNEQALQDALQDLDLLQQHTIDDHHYASIVYENLHQPGHAIQAMQDALKIAPDDARLSERLLQLFIREGRYEEALNIVRRQERSWRWLQWEGDILVLQGDDPTATARYGLVLAQLQQHIEQMQEEYFNAIKTRVLLARAHAYRRLGDIDLAREHYLAAQTIVSDDLSIDFNLGLLHLFEGDTERAIQLCQTAWEQAPAALQQEMRESLLADKTLQVLLDALTSEEK